MPRILIFSALVLIWTGIDAGAADLPPGVTCEVIVQRYAEWSHLGKRAIRLWLALNGYSKAQVREAEKCLR